MFLYLLLGLTTLLGVSAATKCRFSDVTDDVVHCYNPYLTSQSFDSAIATCSSSGGHLVTISSQDEYDFVFDVVQGNNTFTPCYNIL